MTKRHRSRIGPVALLTLLLPLLAWAHDGHDHKVMGTVTKIEKPHLTVKTQDGKLVMFKVKDDTTILREQKRLTFGDVAVGDRVVANLGSGEVPLTAKEVRVGPVSTAPPK